MPSKLLGKWKLVKSDNFDEYMKQVGVNIALRKMALIVTSTTEITEEGEDNIRINTQSTFRSGNVLFSLKEAIDEHTMDGRACKTSTAWEGENKIFQTQTWKDGTRKTTLEWIYEDEKMILRLDCDGVISQRTHERCT